MACKSSERSVPVSALIWLTLLGASAGSAGADVVVLANRTIAPVAGRIVIDNEQQQFTIPPGQLHVVPVRKSCQLLYEVSGELVRYQLDPNSVYFFLVNQQGWLDCRGVGLGASEPSETEADNSSSVDSGETVDLPIKILVDDRDPTPRSSWEPRLRKRVARVSEILQQHCRVRLKVVAVDTWVPAGKELDFREMLVDFREQIDPHPARLAIGFTGRYQDKAGTVHLGATQGMLQTHILIREWSRSMSEPERDEVLLHEIGHYLGAVHSADMASVMRPVLADDRAIHRAFRIEFDPVNTLVINLVADEIRTTKAASVGMLSPATRLRLQNIYLALLEATPSDQSIKQYLSQLKMVGGSPLVHATRLVVSAVRYSAMSHRQVRPADRPQFNQDRLTDFYVRRAATAATGLPQELGPSALLLGLGIALDDSESLLSNPITAEFCRKVETAAERRSRLQGLGHPTVRGRRDFAQHFFLSAYLATAVGAPAAESAGLAKELADARSASGFSYRDLAADVAGISFAQRLLSHRLTVEEVAEKFVTVDLMPEVSDLPEGISWNDGGPEIETADGHSLSHYRELIQQRVHQLSAPARPIPAAKGLK